MTTFSLSISDHIFAQIKPCEAYVNGPRTSVGKIVKMYETAPKDVIDAINSKNSPFSESDRINFVSYIQDGGKTERRVRYQTFEKFCYHVSRGRYLPSKPLITLLPTLDMDIHTRQILAISISVLQPGSIKRISKCGYAAQDDAGASVFIQYPAMKCVKMKSVLRMAHYLLCWASSKQDFPKCLKYRPLEPKHDFAEQLASQVLAGAKSLEVAEKYAFYAKILIPKVVENLSLVSGYIVTNYGGCVDEAQDDESDTAMDLCTICQHGLLGPLPTRILKCGHVFHDQCLRLAESSGFSICSLCMC